MPSLATFRGDTNNQKEIKAATKEASSQKDRDVTPTKARQAAQIAALKEQLAEQEQRIVELEQELDSQAEAHRSEYVSRCTPETTCEGWKLTKAPRS